MSGGAGYVLSIESLRRFVEEAVPNAGKCSGEAVTVEDREMGNSLIKKLVKIKIIKILGKCLANVNVVAGDSRDNGKGRFFAFQPTQHLFPDGKVDYHGYLVDNPLLDVCDCVCVTYLS